MEANNKVYGFVIALYEYRRTVETLWDATREFARLHPEYIADDNAIRFLVDDERKGLQDGDWNNWCVEPTGSPDLKTTRRLVYGRRADPAVTGQSLLVQLRNRIPQILAEQALPRSAFSYRSPFEDCG